MNLNKFKFYFINFILIIVFTTSVSAKKVPASFADLAEKLMPSVVNISTTQTIKGTVNPLPFDFQFLQDHLLKICLKILTVQPRDKLVLWDRDSLLMQKEL